MKVGTGAVLAVLLLCSTARAQVARVAVVQRVAEKKSGAGGAWVRAAAGTPLLVNDRFRTGRRSKADLKFAGGSLLRLGQLSSLDIRSTRGVALTGGQLLFSALRPGLVLAGSAAAEIKGSVGIISLRDDGSAEFTLYSGAMDVVSGTRRIEVPPGRAITALPDGTLSGLRVAAPLNYAGGTTSSELSEAPDTAPYAGSEANIADRSAPDRLSLDQNLSSGTLSVVDSGLRGSFNPVASVVPEPPPPPEPPPFPVPFPTLPPATAASAEQARSITRASKLNLKQSRPRSAAKTARGRLNSPGWRAGTPVDFVADNSLHSLAPISIASTGGLPGVTDGADAANESVAGLDLDLAAAYAHLRQANRDSGRLAGGDFRLSSAFGDAGARASGARLEAFGARGRFFLNVALQRAHVERRSALGDTNLRLGALSDAALTYRAPRFDLQIGRQRFLAGPTQAALFGSLVRQGARDTMDAVRFSPRLGSGARLDLAYLFNAFPRDLPYRLSERQSGFYARFALRKRMGSVGLNLLRYQNAPAGGTTGATLDLVLPLLRNNIELYGEVGRDPFRRRLSTVGFTLPVLHESTGFDLFVEYARLGSRGNLAGPPNELAVRLYRTLNENIALVGGLSRFNGLGTKWTLGVTGGQRFSGN